jgi:hypothetical protein
MNYLLRLASNHTPPDLCLLSSWDYRHELPAPNSGFLFYAEGQRSYSFPLLQGHSHPKSLEGKAAGALSVTVPLPHLQLHEDIASNSHNLK